MSLAYLKLGLIHRWAAYNSNKADKTVVMTGQAQVHEPRTTIEPTARVRKLVNSSGLSMEDCRGTARPAFPFYNGHTRGTIAFYGDPQIPVSRGETPLIVPWPVWATRNMSIVAAYIMMFTPWPCGNLSLRFTTKADESQTPRQQVFSWYGTTLALPGELNISVVIPRPSTANLEPDKEWTLPLTPTMGPTPVHHYAAYAPIPVVFHDKDKRKKTKLVDFCVSWIDGLRTTDIESLMGILELWPV